MGTLKRPISKSEFARLCGVTAAAVTKATREGGELWPAMDGKRVDSAHPIAVEFRERNLARKSGVKPERKKPAAKKKPAPAAPEPKPPRTPRGRQAQNLAKKNAPTGEADQVVPENIAYYADMTLRDLISKFGTDARFLDWLKALKAIEEIRDKRIRNADREGELIPRVLVQSHVVGAFEAAHINMLTDGAKTISAQLSAMVKAGSEPDECEQVVSDILSKMIRAAKGKAARVLKNAC